MDIESKDVFYILGILVTLGLGTWNFVYARQAARKSGFVNTVTAQRVVWIELLRQDIARFVGLTHNWAVSRLEGTAEENEVLQEIDTLKNTIRLRLNPDDTNDRKIAALIKRVPELTHEIHHEELRKVLEEIVVTTQRMLKDEWEKVKKESKDGDLNDLDT